MTNKNIKFCRNLFAKFLKLEDTDFFVVLDYYSLKVIDLLKNYKSDEAEKYSLMFREFEAECFKSSNPKIKDVGVFFFALSNILVSREMINDKEYMILYVKNLMEIVNEDIVLEEIKNGW